MNEIRQVVHLWENVRGEERVSCPPQAEATLVASELIWAFVGTLAAVAAEIVVDESLRKKKVFKAMMGGMD
eukprot:2274075-Rhodomonas_salina.3